jgi:hypothetical protein
MEKVATLIAVPGGPLLFLLIYILQRQEGREGLGIICLVVYVVLGLGIATAASRERLKRKGRDRGDAAEGGEQTK